MSKAPNLTITQCKEAFGVSHVAIFNWTKTLDFPPLGERTPGNLKRWAKKTGKPMAREPLDVVLGRSNKKADAALKRTASGRMTSARPAAPKRAAAAKKASATKPTARAH